MDGETAGAPEAVLLEWDARIRLLGNPDVWSGVLMALGIPGLLLGGLVGVVTKDPGLALMVPLALVGGLLALFVLISLVVDLFGGFRAHFILTTDGVRALSGKAAKAVSTATIVAGLLAGSLGAAGSGLLAKSEQNVFIPWRAVSRIKVSAGRRYVLVKAGFAEKPIGLACTAETFARVMEILCARAQRAMAAAT